MAQKQKIKEKYAQFLERHQQEKQIMDQLNGTNFNTTGNDQINRQNRQGNMSLKEFRNNARAQAKAQYEEERRQFQETGARWEKPEPSERGKKVIEGLKEYRKRKGQ